MKDQIEDVKLSSEEQANRISVGEDKFLFCFKPENLDNECIFGISLVNGVKIFAAVALLQSLSFLMEIFQTQTFFKKLGYIILTCLFVLISFCAFFSTLNDNMVLANISYCVASAIFLIAGVIFLIEICIKLFEFINPWEGDFLDLGFLTDVFGIGFYLFIYGYFIWIIYCYMGNHVKNN